MVEKLLQANGLETTWPTLEDARNLPPVYEGKNKATGFASRMILLALYEKRRSIGMPGPSDRNIQDYFETVVGKAPSTSQVSFMIGGLVERHYLKDWSTTKGESRTITLSVIFHTIKTLNGSFANIDEFLNVEGLTGPRKN